MSGIEERVTTATELAYRYAALSLPDRAADWLLMVSPLLDDRIDPRVFRRYQLVAVSVWLDRGDIAAAARALESRRVRSGL